MAFYVTPNFKVYDTEETFKSLSPQERVDLLYNARDIWEKNEGQWKGKRPLPSIVTGKIDPEKTYGTVEP